jgi:glycosyltransferase involved in cell wall biosynthesis
MTNPDISLILLSHNRPKFVYEAVNSMLDQTFKNFELIIIENSTDGITRGVLDNFKDDRIKIYHENPTVEERKAQCIVAVYSNKYIDLTKGKYIYFASDDDMLLPQCLETYFNFSESHGGCHSHGGLYVLEYAAGGRPLKSVLPSLGCTLNDKWIPQESMWKFLGEHNFPNMVFNSKLSPSCRVSVSALLIRKDYLLEQPKPYFRGLDPYQCGTSDAMFTGDLAVRHDIVPVNKVLGIFRQHANWRSFEFWREGWRP